jgi:hypothetical protein
MWAKSVFRWIDAHLFFPLETVEGKIGPSLLLYPAINQGAAINWVRTALLVDDANKISAGCLPRVLTAPLGLFRSPYGRNDRIQQHDAGEQRSRPSPKLFPSKAKRPKILLED